MPAAHFRLLSDMNFLGGSVFVATLIALLFYYPRRIASPWVGRATLALFIGWFVAQAFDLFGSMIFARRSFVFTGLIATFIRSEEHTSELQSLMRISYAVFCSKNKKT